MAGSGYILRFGFNVNMLNLAIVTTLVMTVMVFVEAKQDLFSTWTSPPDMLLDGISNMASAVSHLSSCSYTVMCR